MIVEAEAFVDVNSPLGKLDRRCYGQFVEHLGKCIYGGIWVGEDSEIPNIKGFRKDVLEAVKALNPPIMRWPGGNFSSGYHWEDGIGPREKRPKRLDLAWGAGEPNKFGTDEFIEWCKLVETKPFIVVNAGNGSPEEAAKWVEYCNLTRDTCYASLRQMYGHKEPYDVRLWGIGNELYGRWQVGFCVDGEECARRTVEFANEMQKADPSMELVAVGCEDPEWNLNMVKNAGKYFDYLSVHIYVRGGGSYRELAAVPVDIERRLRAVYSLVETSRRNCGIDKEIKLAFDEWNVWYPEAKAPLHEQVPNVKDAVFSGLVLNSLHRLCREVPIGGFAQTVNVLPLITTSDDGSMFVNPQYLVFKMYGENTGDQVVKAVVDAPSYYCEEPKEYVSFIDLSATLSSDGRTLYLHAVNRHEEESAELKVMFRGFRPKTASSVFVSGGTLDDRNTFDEPDKVKIEKGEARIVKDEAVLTVRPHSVNVMVTKQG